MFFQRRGQTQCILGRVNIKSSTEDYIVVILFYLTSQCEIFEYLKSWREKEEKKVDKLVFLDSLLIIKQLLFVCTPHRLSSAGATVRPVNVLNRRLPEGEKARRDG